MKKIDLSLQDYIKELPHLPGVYRMLGEEGDVLYVGKAIDLNKRVGSYFQKSNQSARIKLMLLQVAKIETTVTRSEAEALILEHNLIKALNPRYNIVFRDDKTYPYVVLTNHTFPKLGYYRGALDKKNTYFGPYPNVVGVRHNIEMLQRTFRLRTCEDSVFQNRSRPCLLYQIKRCTGPCAGLISQEDYQEEVNHAIAFMQGKTEAVVEKLRIKMEGLAKAWQFEEAAFCRDQIQALNQLQARQYANIPNKEGDVDVVVCVREQGITCINRVMIRAGRQLGDKSIFPLKAESEELEDILEAFLMQHYFDKNTPEQIICFPPIKTETLGQVLSEKAQKKVAININPARTNRAWLEMAKKNAHFAIANRIGQEATQVARYQQLAELLGLSEEGGRIECFDVSHTMGEETVASCVVYEAHRMQPSEYRRFNIKGITPSDDYAAMAQVLSRRYERLIAEEGKIPDLILIDGGKGQLHIAEKILHELGLNQILLVGVAKGEKRKPGMETLIVSGQEKTLQLTPTHPALHLIQQIRDEAHRFAITGHRMKRAKKRLHSTLEDIPGIGAKRRRQLLTKFGGLQALKAASVEELAKTEGISQVMAIKIYQFLHE